MDILLQRYYKQCASHMNDLFAGHWFSIRSADIGQLAQTGLASNSCGQPCQLASRAPSVKHRDINCYNYEPRLRHSIRPAIYLIGLLSISANPKREGHMTKFGC